MHSISMSTCSELLGSRQRWPWLLGFTGFTALLQLCTLPFLPESPRFLLLERGDQEACERGHYLLTLTYTQTQIHRHTDTQLNCNSVVMQLWRGCGGTRTTSRTCTRCCRRRRPCRRSRAALCRSFSWTVRFAGSCSPSLWSSLHCSCVASMLWVGTGGEHSRVGVGKIICHTNCCKMLTTIYSSLPFTSFMRIMQSKQPLSLNPFFFLKLNKKNSLTKDVSD